MRFSRLFAFLRRSATRLAGHEGQTMPEYALLLGVIALIIFVAATLLGSNTSSLLSSTGTHL